MANKVRFTDQLTVNSFGNVSPEAIITASGGVGNIVFTKANGNQITLPLAASASNATALITASANENVLTFTFGDLSTFDVTVATGSGGGESTNTGSLLTTGSVSGNVLTFTKGDGTSFTMTVDTGSSLPSGVISSSIQISELGFVTSSATASFITNSQTSSMSVLSAQTASYVLNAISSSFSSFAVSASYAVSSSHEIIKEVSSSHANFADTASKSLDNVLTASVSSNTITFTKGDNTTFNLIVDTGSGEPLPSGTVSSSTQISELGFVTSSATASFITNSQTSSMSVATASFVQNAISSSYALTASYAVSASFEIIKEVSSSYADTASYVENAQSASFVTIAQTASYIQKDNIDGLLISSSAQIASDISGAFGAASASFSTRVSANEVITSKTLISGSTQITDLGFINQTQTSSMSVATASFVQDAISSSYALTASYALNAGESVPSGTVSSSAQITDLGFVQSAITASSLDTASVSNNTITFTKGNGDTFDITVNTGSGTSIDTGSFVQNSQTSSMTVGTSSITNFVPFNGNRAISNQDQPTGIKNVNFEANGLADFINKVYFTNTAPTITTSGFTIGEFVASGSTVGTVTSTDPESGSQTTTYGTSSTYTDDFFRINGSTGVVTLNTKSTSSMNTVNTGSSLKAPFPVVATDSFGETGSRTLYIRVTPNTAPIWSENAGVGSVTEITESIAEDSAAGTDKDRYYFRDTESDTITIGSGSFSTHFTTAFALTLQSGYVRLDQITASLDFDLYPTYSFILTASDEHYESGDDPSSITYLPVRINVTDNQGPSINPETLAGVNESGSTGNSAGNISTISDTEGNTVTISQFQLVSAFLNSDPTTNLTSSLGNASLSNPASDPFSVLSTSPFTVSRKAGQFLNADIADRYTYRTTVRDDFNPVSQSAIITIPIADHTPNTISISSVANIIETATTGNTIKQSATGLGGSNTILSATNSSIQRWSITSTPDLIEATNITASSTTLQLKSNLSGSATVGGDTITLQITASQDNFDTTIQYLDKVVDVELMAAPVLTPSDQTSNLNTNGARGSNNLVLVSITDPQSFTIDHSTWTFTPNAGQALEAVQNGGADSYYVRPTSNLAAGTYGYTASIFNDKGFRAGELKDEFTIAQAPVGSLTTNGTFYIIESALNGANIVLNSNGRTGTQGDLGVTYSPQYNSAAVSSFASSNAAIAVASNGNLTAGQNVSGSSNTFPGTITSNITWQDQYGNAGGPTTITVNIAENALPTAILNLGATSLLTASLAVSGSVIASLTGSDSQGFENITSASLSGTGASSFNLVDKTGASITRKYEIQPLSDLSAGDYSITGSVVDAFNQSSSANLDISIAVLPTIPEVYVYSSTRGSGAPIPANYDALLGDETTTGTPIKEWASGSLGNEGPITLSGGVMRLIGSASAGLAGSSLNTIVSSTIGTVNPAENEAGNHLIYLVYPSGSDPRLSGSPTSMGDAFGGSTLGEYLLYYFTNAADKGIIGSQLNSFDLSTGYTASDGTIKTDYNRWTVLGCNNSKFSSTSTKFYVVPTSGSAPA